MGHWLTLHCCRWVGWKFKSFLIPHSSSCQSGTLTHTTLSPLSVIVWPAPWLAPLPSRLWGGREGRKGRRLTHTTLLLRVGVEGRLPSAYYWYQERGEAEHQLPFLMAPYSALLMPSGGEGSAPKGAWWQGLEGWSLVVTSSAFYRIIKCHCCWVGVKAPLTVWPHWHHPCAGIRALSASRQRMESQLLLPPTSARQGMQDYLCAQPCQYHQTGKSEFPCLLRQGRG